MKVNGDAVLHAPPATVFAALNDPEVLARTIPGCRSLTPLGEDRYAMAVTAGGVHGNPASPHFADEAQAYADGRLLPVPFDARDVAAQAVAVYRPGERR